MKLGIPSSVAIRTIAYFIGMFGTLFANRITLLLGGLLFVLVVLGVQQRLAEFARFTYIVLLPIGILIMLAWGRVFKSYANEKSWFGESTLSVICVILRLALLGAIFLVAVLTLSPKPVAHLFRLFGIQGRTLAVMISCMNLWTGLGEQIKQVYRARCVRGLVPDRRLFTRLRQLPSIVRTIFVLSLTHSVGRADMWECRGLVSRLEDLYPNNIPAAEAGSRFAAICLLIVSLGWTVIAIAGHV